MTMRLLQKGEVTFKSISSFETLDFFFHGSKISRHSEGSVIMEMYVVVGLAFHEIDAFGFQGGAQVLECLMEESWEEQQAWPLIESLIL